MPQTIHFIVINGIIYEIPQFLITSDNLSNIISIENK